MSELATETEKQEIVKSAVAFTIPDLEFAWLMLALGITQNQSHLQPFHSYPMPLVFLQFHLSMKAC